MDAYGVPPNPMDAYGVPTVEKQPMHGLKSPPSSKDLIGATLGAAAGGLPGAVVGVAAPRIMGSVINGIGSLFSSTPTTSAVPVGSSSSGAAVPMGTTVAVQMVEPGKYLTSYGNTVDVSQNPIDVMQQPGGAEALAAAGQQSLVDSGLHNTTDGGVSKEVQDAIDSGMGGLF
jgi:hypothetical protein